MESLAHLTNFYTAEEAGAIAQWATCQTLHCAVYYVALWVRIPACASKEGFIIFASSVDRDVTGGPIARN